MQCPRTYYVLCSLTSAPLRVARSSERSVHPRTRLRECMRKQQPDRDANAHERNCETNERTWQTRGATKHRGLYTFLLDSRKIWPFASFCARLSLSTSARYILFSFYTGGLHAPRDIRRLHGAVSCDVTLVHHPPSCIRHTKFSFFLPHRHCSSLVSRPFFFLPSLSTKYISDMPPITEDIMWLGK